MANEKAPVKTGWSSRLTRISFVALSFLSVSGLIMTFSPFHAAVEWTVLVHTVLGLVALVFEDQARHLIEPPAELSRP